MSKRDFELKDAIKEVRRQISEAVVNDEKSEGSPKGALRLSQVTFEAGVSFSSTSSGGVSISLLSGKLQSNQTTVNKLTFTFDVYSAVKDSAHRLLNPVDAGGDSLLGREFTILAGSKIDLKKGIFWILKDKNGNEYSYYIATGELKPPPRPDVQYLIDDSGRQFQVVEGHLILTSSSGGAQSEE